MNQVIIDGTKKCYLTYAGWVELGEDPVEPVMTIDEALVDRFLAKITVNPFYKDRLIVAHDYDTFKSVQAFYRLCKKSNDLTKESERCDD
ncbi:MAG: hypothetical protein PVI90_09255 [Desulfobacteraceae bacterium]|jgi:hypothetical protein